MVLEVLKVWIEWVSRALFLSVIASVPKQSQVEEVLEVVEVRIRSHFPFRKMGTDPLKHYRLKHAPIINNSFCHLETPFLAETLEQRQ